MSSTDYHSIVAGNGPLRQRIDAAIAYFVERHPDYGDTSITHIGVDRSNRGKGPGLSAYVFTRCEMGFEIPIRDGESVASLLREFNEFDEHCA